MKNSKPFDFFSIPIDVYAYGLTSKDVIGTPLGDSIHRFWNKKKKATWELGIDMYSPFTRSHRDFLLSSKKERVMLGGNSSAKSWTGAAFVTALALGKHPTITDIKVPNSGWLACEDFSLTKEGPVKALTILGKNYIKDINVHDKEIHWINGSVTGIKSYESGWKKFQAAEKDYVWLDEEPPIDIYKECQMRTMRASGYILTTMTPLEGMTWMYETLEEDGGQNIEVIQASLFDNYTLKPEDIERTIRDYSEEDYSARVEGNFTQMAGIIYKEFKREFHVIKPFKLNREDFICFAGIDPHITTPTAVTFLNIHKSGMQFITDELFVAGTIPEIAQEIKKIEKKYRMGFRVMDSAAKTDIRIYGCDIWSDFTKNGIASILAPKGDGSIGKGVSDIREKLKINPKNNKPELMVFDNCKNTIRAFKSLTRERYRDESKRGKKDKIAETKWHNHAALRYIYQLQPTYSPPMDKFNYNNFLDSLTADEVIGV
jgi:phage terminase large subunit-like protein